MFIPFIFNAIHRKSIFKTMVADKINKIVYYCVSCGRVFS